MYSTHSEGKFAVPEGLLGALKIKIYKYMTLISKNLYIDKLDHIVNEYNNADQRTMEMKLVDVKSGNYVKYNVNCNDKDP